MDKDNERETIEYILKNYKNIAVVGISRDPHKPARRVPKFLKAHGYNIIPVNPFADEILGRRSYKDLLEIPKDIQIDIVEIFRPSKDVTPIVEQAIERHKSYGDVKVIWMQEGIKNEEAKKKAEEVGITVIQDRCMYKEYVRQIERREPEEL